jgi:hypothetical protein
MLDFIETVLDLKQAKQQVKNLQKTKLLNMTQLQQIKQN